MSSQKHTNKGWWTLFQWCKAKGQHQAPRVCAGSVRAMWLESMFICDNKSKYRQDPLLDLSRVLMCWSGRLIFDHTHKRTQKWVFEWNKCRMLLKLHLHLEINERNVSGVVWIHDRDVIRVCLRQSVTCACLFTWAQRCSTLECIHKPFQLVMASSPSHVSPFSSLSLHYPECLIMASAFWEHVNMAATPLARKVLFLSHDWLTGEEPGW